MGELGGGIIHVLINEWTWRRYYTYINQSEQRHCLQSNQLLHDSYRKSIATIYTQCIAMEETRLTQMEELYLRIWFFNCPLCNIDVSSLLGRRTVHCFVWSVWRPFSNVCVFSPTLKISIMICVWRSIIIQLFGAFFKVSFPLSVVFMPALYVNHILMCLNTTE